MDQVMHIAWQELQRSTIGPAWRWTKAQEFARVSATRRRPEHLDQIVHDAADYLRRCAATAQHGQEASRTYPLVAAAAKLAGDSAVDEKLKILVMAKCPRSDMAARLGVPEDVILMWEDLFFDVRIALASIGWVVAHVISPARTAGSGALAARFQLAYLGELVAAEAILAVDAELPLLPATRLFDVHLKLHLKMIEAAEMPLVSGRDALRLQKFYLQLRLKEQQLELAKTRLQERCAAALRRHELKLARIAARAAKQVRRQKERGVPHDETVPAAHEESLAAAASPLASLAWRSIRQDDASRASKTPGGLPDNETVPAPVEKSQRISA
jgi:hypothetical protein